MQQHDDPGDRLLVSNAPHYDWRPQPDITAYELALCMPILMSNDPRVVFAVRDLPHVAGRHFVRANREGT